MATTEHTINDALASVLRRTKRIWSVHGVISSENTKMLKGSAGRPDIIIQEPNVSPVTIETEVLPAITVEPEARSRLGCAVATTGRPILASIAMRLPTRLRSLSGLDLQGDLSKAADLEYALFTGTSQTEADRWPSSGWLKGSTKDISILAQSAAVPPALIEDTVNNLVAGVSEAAGILDQIAVSHRAALKQIAEALYQEDCTQTRRMAATILSDAFVFHESLAGASDQLKSVRSLEELRGANELSKTSLLAEWRKILKVNYWPIFDISRRILESVPTVQSKSLIEKLADTADQLVENQLMRSHDLTGAVFQKLISDRKFLAAYYTTPASAALMAGLLLPQTEDLPNGRWGEGDSLKQLRIGDFACGTGTLLSTVYQRLGQIHELHGGDSRAIHADLMGKSLVGCDVLPAAAHLTASMLSGAHPTVVYQESNIMTVAYGRQDDSSVALGSLDLLDSQRRFGILSITAQKIEGKGATAGETWADLPHDSFDVVVMNPPFTRATGHEGKKVGVPNPMFAAFRSSKEEQRQMAKATKRLTVNTCYHGNAGEGSIFVALGDRKLKQGGKVGLILPLSMVTGDAWEATRQLFRKGYSKLIVLSVTGQNGGVMSFSADTGMGECMLVATKAKSDSKRAVFVTFNQTPAFPMIGANAARQITQNLAEGNIAKLEDGPNGGTDISFGDDLIGSMIDARLPDEGGWNLARIADMSLAQTAYQLTRQSRAWLPTMAETAAIAIPMLTVGQIAEIGPYHSDIEGKTSKGGVRGPFKTRDIPTGIVPTYPCLWRHTAERERTLSFEADMEAVPLVPKDAREKKIIDRKVTEVWATASHLHFNRDFRFNSQSTAFQFTPRPSLGGRAWLSVNIGQEVLEKIACLWGNCILGLAVNWYYSNKQQAGRGSIGKNQLFDLPILDVTSLSDQQVKAGAQVFDNFAASELLPLHELNNDTNRQNLDRRFLTECLGFPDAVVSIGGPLDILRTKLAREPSIRGHKA